MTAPESGQTGHVSLRDIWLNETLDFTPWLAENLHLLGKAIGMELSLIQTEASGWSGYLDILAEATGKGKVAIENQIEPSDNDHFARLIGYAADCNADVLVWVAPHFWEYHQRQLGWLKEAMDGKKEIYAVVASLAPDGDLRSVNSHPDAPGFHAVFSSIDLHNNWSKAPVLTPEEQANLPQKRQAFFQRLLRDLREQGFTDRMAPRAGRSQSFASDFPGIAYNAGFEWSKPFVFLSIYLGSRAESGRIFDALSEYRLELERELPDLQFDVIGQHGGWRRSSVGMTRDGHIGDPDEALDEIKDWMCENIVKLKNVIEPRLEKVMEEFRPTAMERGS